MVTLGSGDFRKRWFREVVTSGSEDLGKSWLREVVTFWSGDFEKGWLCEVEVMTFIEKWWLRSVTEWSGVLKKWSSRHYSGCFDVFRMFLHIAVAWCFGTLKVAKRNVMAARMLHGTCVGVDAGSLCFFVGDKAYLVCATDEGRSFWRGLVPTGVLHRAVVRLRAVFGLCGGRSQCNGCTNVATFCCHMCVDIHWVCHFAPQIAM